MFTPVTLSAAYVTPVIVPTSSSDPTTTPSASLILSTDDSGHIPQILYRYNFASQTSIETSVTSDVPLPSIPSPTILNLLSPSKRMLAIVTDRLYILNLDTLSPILSTGPIRIRRSGIDASNANTVSFNAQPYSPTFSADGSRLYCLQEIGYFAVDLDNKIPQLWYFNASLFLIQQGLVNSSNSTSFILETIFVSEAVEVVSPLSSYYIAGRPVLLFNVIDSLHDVGYLFILDAKNGSLLQWKSFIHVGHDLFTTTPLPTTTTTTSTFPFDTTTTTTTGAPTAPPTPQRYHQLFAPIVSPLDSRKMYLILARTAFSVSLSGQLSSVSNTTSSIDENWRTYFGFKASADVGADAAERLNTGAIIAPPFLFEDPDDSRQRLFVQLSNVQERTGKIVAMDTKNSGVIIKTLTLAIANGLPDHVASQMQSPAPIYFKHLTLTLLLFAQTQIDQRTGNFQIVIQQSDMNLGNVKTLSTISDYVSYNGFSFYPQVLTNDDTPVSVAVSLTSRVHVEVFLTSALAPLPEVSPWDFFNPHTSIGFSRVAFATSMTTSISAMENKFSWTAASKIPLFVVGSMIQDDMGEYAGEVFGVIPTTKPAPTTTTLAPPATLPSVLTQSPLAAATSDNVGGLSGGALAAIIIVGVLVLIGGIIYYCVFSQDSGARTYKTFRRHVEDEDEEEFLENNQEQNYDDEEDDGGEEEEEVERRGKPQGREAYEEEEEQFNQNRINERSGRRNDDDDDDDDDDDVDAVL
jgi:hypothetical protein